jgi:hypothetical protein
VWIGRSKIGDGQERQALHQEEGCEASRRLERYITVSGEGVRTRDKKSRRRGK